LLKSLPFHFLRRITNDKRGCQLQIQITSARDPG
jgi:hypothetical protein